jgi:hypothetical protein
LHVRWKLIHSLRLVLKTKARTLTLEPKWKAVVQALKPTSQPVATRQRQAAWARRRQQMTQGRRHQAPEPYFLRSRPDKSPSLRHGLALFASANSFKSSSSAHTESAQPARAPLA